MATSSLAALLDDHTLVADVRSLSEISHWRVVLAIARQWLIIAAVIAAALYFNAWWAYLPAIVVIASRQHALGVIMHDATHYRLFRSRTANELVSDLSCAFPILLSTQGYRDEHLVHHRTTNTLDDPYYRMFQSDAAWHWPKSRWGAIRQLLADVTGWNTPRMLRMNRRWSPLGQWLKYRSDPKLGGRSRIDFATCIGFWGVVAAGLAWSNGWLPFLLLWVCPLLTFYPLFVRLRWISEHPYGEAGQSGYETRHVQGSLLERLTIAPLNINYHIAHHLFPATPFYRLPGVHRRLLECPSYREEATLYQDYLGKQESIRSILVGKGAA